ncbi:chemotaxis protein CheW [Marinitoga sp. 38H-ov]|uniref:chemotaxis protein CheW n=1 Tax=Marinitoga sp. 38H-ov TaxID=1755814 RepID=UPI0013EDF4CB|nr:chemotaxis protein CheW [Marinitoga sp. 38H-ov]KAF2955206.1 hypothetical protein AS160_01515 [Marinitoga sp. 38H-ov]
MNYIIFSLNEQEYCIPMNEIREIVDLKKITKIPLAPDYVEGLINLRGEIIPVINLKTKLGLKSNYNSKIIILNNNIGILVDSINGILSKFDEKIETKSKYVNSVIKNGENEYFLLDINKLIEVNNKKIQSTINRKKIKKQNKKIKMKKIITFKVNGEIYGFEINQIFEIINYFEPNKVPINQDCVKGIISERGEVIPVIDLKKLLYNIDSKINKKTKIAIIDVDGYNIGVIVEEIHRIVEVEKIKEFPYKNLLKGYIKTKDFSAVILDINNVLNDEIKFLNKKSVKVQKDKVKKDKYLLFNINNEKYALELKLVKEINRLNKITKVPYSSYVRGISNLRGNILPIIDLKKRLGFEEIKNKFSRVIVSNIDNQLIGFLVDSVNNIISMEYIQFKSSDKFIKGIGKYNNESVLLIDLNKIVDKEELKRLNESIYNSKTDNSKIDKTKLDKTITDKTRPNKSRTDNLNDKPIKEKEETKTIRKEKIKNIKLKRSR